MKYAWAENNTIRDICQGDPQECYTPEVAAHYTTEVPDDIVNGATWDGSKWVNPPAPPAPPAPVPQYSKTMTPIEFRLLFVSAERIAIKTAAKTDPIVEDFWSIINDPELAQVNVADAQIIEALDYLVTIAILTPAREATILLGKPL